jgi:hypothetical protein
VNAQPRGASLAQLKLRAQALKRQRRRDLVRELENTSLRSQPAMHALGVGV